MPALSPSAKISVSLVCIATSVFFVAFACQLVPDYHATRLEERKVFSEQLAIHCSFALKQDDARSMKEIVLACVRRNKELASAGLRTAAGELVLEIGDHQGNWDAHKAAQPNPDNIQVPIFLGDALWGKVELRYQPLAPAGFWWLLRHPVIPFVLFFGAVCFILFFLFIRQMFKQINTAQARVVPKRVRDTLDTLAEGVVILDKQGQIVMANEAFADAIGTDAGLLQGQKVSDLAWKNQAPEETALPWDRTLVENKAQTGAILSLECGKNRTNILSVNSMPIVGDDGQLRGALASFDNLTALEKKNASLKKLLNKLNKSRAEIQRQNQQLQDLATRDSLTGCWNRRAFFSEFESRWSSSQRYGHPLSCIMVDADHFKSINDNHGHSMGDKVLQQIAATLRETSRQSDLVCRYGGEEFCVLLPQSDLDEAARAAERFRLAIEQRRRPAGVTVTASVGVSAVSLGARNAQELLEQADKAMYVAKRTGRNRVVSWADVPADQTFEKEQGRTSPTPEASPPAISFHAVSALLSALSYRHAETAEHSHRVADLCVTAAGGLLSLNDCYVLEVAALLHDIGKLGVPDAILFKSTPLTDAEWKVLRTHEAIGEGIVAAAFASEPLTQIIRCHHFPLSAKADDRALAAGEPLPTGARILAIADAFDAMVTDQVYRKARSQDEAFAELRRCAGRQFDAGLVEHFIQKVTARDQNRAPAGQSRAKQTALQINMQLEKLAIAADVQDRTTILLMADSLHALAAGQGMGPIAENALRLRDLAVAAHEPSTLTEPALDLIDLCRSTCDTLLAVSETPALSA